MTHVLGQQKCGRSQGNPFLMGGTHPALAISAHPERQPLPAPAEVPTRRPAEAQVASQAPGSPKLLPLAPRQALNEGVLERDFLRNKPTFHSPGPGSAISTAPGQRDEGPALPQATGLYHRFLVTASGGTICKTLSDPRRVCGTQCIATRPLWGSLPIPPVQMCCFFREEGPRAAGLD